LSLAACDSRKYSIFVTDRLVWTLHEVYSWQTSIQTAKLRWLVLK
jgi:hypothetical protein